jgi:hypothetical protein
MGYTPPPHRDDPDAARKMLDDIYRNKQRLVIAAGAFLLSLLVLLVSRSQGQVQLGTYFDALFFNSRDLRLQDRPPLKDAGFLRIASSITPADTPFLEACQKDGQKVLYTPNTTTDQQDKDFFAKFSCIDVYSVADDANIGNTPQGLRQLVTAAKAKIRPDMKTFATFGRDAKPADWANISEIVGLQLYTHGEVSLRKWYWEYVRDWRAVHTGKIWVHPYLGKRAAPFFGQYPAGPNGTILQPDAFWSAQEYTPVAWNEAAIWAALCAGADDILYYSAYAISPSYPAFEYRIVKRWDLLPGYKAVNARIRFYERFFAGVRTPFDDGTVVGAKWVLPTGETLTVNVDTFEWRPLVSMAISMPTKPQPAVITQTETGLDVRYVNP